MANYRISCKLPGSEIDLLGIVNLALSKILCNTFESAASLSFVSDFVRPESVVVAVSCAE